MINENNTQPVQLATDQEGGLNFVKLLHGLRRKWLLATLCGIPLAAGCAVLLWLLIPVRYEAVAELLVNSKEDRLLPSIDARGRSQFVSADYEIFRQTQASYVTSSYVLNPVLNKPEIANLNMLDKSDVPNPLGFLQENIKVSFPNDSEFMHISLAGENPGELKVLVDAVTDSYLELTVGERHKTLVERAEQLEKEYRDNAADIRESRERIHTRQVQLGARDASRNHIRHQLELEKLRKLDSSRATLEGRIYEIDLRLALAETEDETPVATGENEPPDYLVAEALERDTQYSRLLEELELAQQQYTSIAATARGSSPSVQRAASQAELIAQQLAARRRELSRRVEQRFLDELNGTEVTGVSLNKAIAERDILVERFDEVKRQHEDQVELVRQLDGYSAQLETDREELAYEVKLNQARQAEIQDLRVQIASPPRIVKIQSASVPNSNSRQTKLIQTICSALVVLGLVVAGFVAWDVAQAPVNSAAHAAEVTGLPVLGKLPAFRSRWKPGAGMSTRSERAVTESIAGLRTALSERTKATPGAKLVMVTSAVGGEGKTILASQLAVGFAKAGKRTLLIDADTQKPRQHVAFGVEASPGLCDCLRENTSLTGCALPSGYDGLSVLPAGQRDADSQRAMAGETLDALLIGLQDQFDFVIVDAGPVLTNVEPLIVAPKADAVVLSVMRDDSRAGKVVEARDKVTAVGAKVSGIVVHNVSVATRRGGVAS